MKKSEWKELYRTARCNSRKMSETESHFFNVEGTVVSSRHGNVFIYPSLIGDRVAAGYRSLSLDDFGKGVDLCPRQASVMVKKLQRIQAYKHGFKLP